MLYLCNTEIKKTTTKNNKKMAQRMMQIGIEFATEKMAKKMEMLFISAVRIGKVIFIDEVLDTNELTDFDELVIQVKKTIEENQLKVKEMKTDCTRLII